MTMEAVLFDFTDSNKLLNNYIDAFANGFIRGGGKLQKIDILKIQIQDCKGCTEDIFFLPNGFCQCNDEFSNFYPILKRSEFWFMVFDIEGWNYLPKLINVLDRMEPLFDTSLNGESISTKNNILAFIFSGGRKSNAQPIEQMLTEFSELFDNNYLGNIRRSNYDFFSLLPVSVLKEFGFEQDFEQLGFELATKGEVNSAIVKRIERDILTEDSFLKDFASLFRYL